MSSLSSIHLPLYGTKPVIWGFRADGCLRASKNLPCLGTRFSGRHRVGLSLVACNVLRGSVGLSHPSQGSTGMDWLACVALSHWAAVSANSVHVFTESCGVSEGDGKFD